MKELILDQGKCFARVEILEGILVYGLEKGLQFWLSILTLERNILKPWVFPRMWNVLLRQVLPFWKKRDLLIMGKRVPALGAEQWVQWLYGCMNSEISLHAQWNADTGKRNGCFHPLRYDLCSVRRHCSGSYSDLCFHKAKSPRREPNTTQIALWEWCPAAQLLVHGRGRTAVV